jgi:carboxypeptidase C (cathepsin A)
MTIMKHLISLLFILAAAFAQAQKPAPATEVKEWIPAGIQATTTHGSATIGGKKFDYTAQSGYLDLKNDTGKVIAKVFFTYYKKDGESDSRRPITFTFNGGPGSSSVWLHLGGLGPRKVQLKDDGTAPAPPYTIVNNENSWLDKTDLVFIDPVSTGFSRPAAGENPGQFHGFNEDVQSVGSFIRHFLTAYERWGSAKFLAGESYGTTRAAGLSKFLQDNYRIYINGIFLISPVLNFGTADFAVGNDLPAILHIPSFTAAAWYHKKLTMAQLADQQKALQESEAFALGEYTTALMQGDNLSEADKAKLAEKVAYFTGLDKDYVLRSNLRIDENRFYKELRRKDGLTIGRLDARFTGRDFDDAGEQVGFDPSFTNIDGPFTSAINDYFERELKVKEDKAYNIFGNVYPWNYNNVQNQYLNVAESLRDAMSKNPALKVYVGSGFYDFATPYFIAKYDIAHLFLRPEFRSNVKHFFYQAGHMYYINKPDMDKMKKDVDGFFEWALSGK